jgi:hypothetical protein
MGPVGRTQPAKPGAVGKPSPSPAGNKFPQRATPTTNVKKKKSAGASADASTKDANKPKKKKKSRGMKDLTDEEKAEFKEKKSAAQQEVQRRREELISAFLKVSTPRSPNLGLKLLFLVCFFLI